MKFALALTALFTTAVLIAAQSGGSAIIHLDQAKIAAALKPGGLTVPADLRASGVRGLIYREAPGNAQIHENETDVLYIVDGSANVVTAGELVGKKLASPGQWVGSDITGGQTLRLAKGDVFVVPAGTPHWFKEIHKSISYFEVKVPKR